MSRKRLTSCAHSDPTCAACDKRRAYHRQYGADIRNGVSRKRTKKTEPPLASTNRYKPAPLGTDAMGMAYIPDAAW